MIMKLTSVSVLLFLQGCRLAKTNGPRMFVKCGKSLDIAKKKDFIKPKAILGNSSNYGANSLVTTVELFSVGILCLWFVFCQSLVLFSIVCCSIQMD